MKLYRGKTWKVDFLPRLGSLWVGLHYSSRYKSVCIALCPCLVVRIGKTIYVKDNDVFDKENE